MRTRAVRRPRARLMTREAELELAHHLLGVFEVGSFFPGRLLNTVSSPLDSEFVLRRVLTVQPTA